MKLTLNLDHRQRSREARRCPLRTSNIEIFIRLSLQIQNRRPQSLLTFISHSMMMQVMPRTQDMNFILSVARFEKMLSRSRTRLFRNLGPEGVRVRFCCKPQWKVCRASPEIERQDTRQHSRASFLCWAMKSPQQTGNIAIRENRQTVQDQRP